MRSSVSGGWVLPYLTTSKPVQTRMKPARPVVKVADNLKIHEKIAEKLPSRRSWVRSSS